MLHLKGLRVGNVLLNIKVVPTLVYSDPPLSEEVAVRRDRFDKWIKELVRRFEPQIADAVEKHIRRARSARKAGGSDS